MEITNDLKAIEEVKGAIKRGYGYEQLKAKLPISEKQIQELCNKHPEFMNELNKRYNLGLVADKKPSENKEIKEETPKKKAKGSSYKNSED